MTEFNPLITGVVHITGPHDVGKTTLALESGAHPSRICIVDDDSKARSTVDQILRDMPDAESITYINFITETAGLSQLQVYDKGSEIIDRIEKGKYDIILWDTWSRYASTMKAHVRKNSLRFREAKDWAGRGDMKGAQEWKEAQGLEATKISLLEEKAPLVFLITHLKNQYIDNKRTGKDIPDASRTIGRIPRLRLWLLRNPSGSPVPIALVLKRVDKKIWVDGKGLRTIAVLPEKINPNIQLPEEDGVTPDDRSLWDTIGRYMKHPFGLRDPLPMEIPDKFERSVIDGTLTEDLKRMWMLRLQASANGHDDDEEELDLLGDHDVERKNFVQEMRDQGASEEKIAFSLKSTLNANYKEIGKALGKSVPEVVKMVKEGKSE